MLAQLASSFEAVLNRNLRASLTARRAAAELDGLCMDLGMAAAEPLLRLSVDGERLRFSEPEETPATVTLAGDWRRLLGLLGGDHSGPGLDLRGDPSVAEEFARLLQHCRPSPEEELARLASDTFARQAGDVAREATHWAEGAAGSVKRNVRDFVQEEARLLPTRVEFDAFAQDVDRLRDTVGRVSARVSALHRGHDAQPGK